MLSYNYVKLLKVLHWYPVTLLSFKIKLQGGLKNNTMHSCMPMRSSLKMTTDS